MNAILKPVAFKFHGEEHCVHFDDDAKAYLRDGSDWILAVKYLKAHIPERDHAAFLNLLFYLKREFAI